MNGKRAKELRKKYQDLLNKEKDVKYDINSQIVEGETFEQFKKRSLENIINIKSWQ